MALRARCCALFSAPRTPLSARITRLTGPMKSATVVALALLESAQAFQAPALRAARSVSKVSMFSEVRRTPAPWPLRG